MNQVMSSAEGQLVDLDNTVTECGTSLHYGNFVNVAGVLYGHLSVLAPSITMGTTLLQGDGVGTQGATGHVLPCEYPTDQRGAHLHWEFRGSSSVPVINGGSSASTNSVAGEFSASGSTLRAYYQSRGGWGNIGWTIDLANGLNMFPNAKWGRMQDFQHHPDGFGGQNNTIHVPAWNPTQAYLVDSTFWAAWAGGAPNSLGALRRLDMAL